MDLPAWAPENVTRFLRPPAEEEHLPLEIQAVLREMRAFIAPLVDPENGALMRLFWGKFCRCAPGQELEFCLDLSKLRRDVASGACPPVSARRKDILETVDALERARKALRRTDPDFRTAAGTRLVNELGLAITKLKATEKYVLPATISASRSGVHSDRIAIVRGVTRVLRAYLGADYGPAMTYQVVAVLLSDPALTITTVTRLDCSAPDVGKLLLECCGSTDLAEMQKDLARDKPPPRPLKSAPWPSE